MSTRCPWFRKLAFPALVLVGAIHAPAFAGDHNQLVLGAGPSTGIAIDFFEKLSLEPESQGYRFVVQNRSTKHAGGIRASDKYLFGRTGRPLDAGEKALGKFEIILAKIPVGFAVGGHVALDNISTGKLEAVFRAKITNWHELDGHDDAIVMVGREKTESALSRLRGPFPFLDGAPYHHVFKRDHSVVAFLSSPAGRNAIGFGALSNFADLRELKVDGVQMDIPVGLVVDNARKGHPVVAAAKRLVKSEDWRRQVVGAGYMNAD